MASNGSQFFIATHSPIILSIKQNSEILSFDFNKITKIDYDMVPCVDMYKRILLNK
jgi:predicted ATPase